VATAATGCGTVVEHTHYEVTDVTRQTRALEPRQRPRAELVTDVAGNRSLHLEQLKICREQVEQVLARDRVVERRVDRAWYYPAPQNHSTSSAWGSVVETLMVIAYAATMGWIDKLRESESREEAEPEVRPQGVISRTCDRRPMGEAWVELVIERDAPEVAWRLVGIEAGPALSQALSERLLPSARTTLRVRSDSMGYVSLDRSTVGERARYVTVRKGGQTLDRFALPANSTPR